MLKKLTESTRQVAKTEEGTPQRQAAVAAFVVLALGSLVSWALHEAQIKQKSDELIEHCVRELTGSGERSQEQRPQT